MFSFKWKNMLSKNFAKMNFNWKRIIAWKSVEDLSTFIICLKIKELTIRVHFQYFSINPSLFEFIFQFKLYNWDNNNGDRIQVWLDVIDLMWLVFENLAVIKMTKLNQKMLPDLLFNELDGAAFSHACEFCNSFAWK